LKVLTPLYSSSKSERRRRRRERNCNEFFSKNAAHHAEGQFNPNPVKKKSLLILDALEHVDSGNIKFKIGRRSSVY
jgi:hypothetical protein